jgi:lactoylglutathione lyase
MVFVVNDVDAEVARVAAAGARVLSGPVDRPWGHRTVHLADPDGFVVELAQEIPRRRLRPDQRVRPAPEPVSPPGRWDASAPR